MSDLVEQAAFLREAASYFEKRDTHGEDKAHWANVFNAKNCREIADALEAKDAEIERLKARIAELEGRERAAEDYDAALRSDIDDRDIWLQDADQRLAALSAENERLRKALEEIYEFSATEPYRITVRAIKDIAREALAAHIGKGEKDGE